MTKVSFCAAGFWLLAATCTHAADAIGFREITWDKDGARPLHVSIWYPTNSEGETAIVGENRAFYGVPAIRDAAPAAGRSWYCRMAMAAAGAIPTGWPRNSPGAAM